MQADTVGPQVILQRLHDPGPRCRGSSPLYFVQRCLLCRTDDADARRVAYRNCVYIAWLFLRQAPRRSICLCVRVWVLGVASLMHRYGILTTRIQTRISLPDKRFFNVGYLQRSRVLGLPQRSRQNLRSSGKLLRVQWYFLGIITIRYCTLHSLVRNFHFFQVRHTHCLF